MVYYRKYRPQTILELDLSTVREKLSAILLSESIPHAFLFAGPKGLGKTSAARIFAKAINCENREQGVKGRVQDNERLNSKDKLNTKPHTLNTNIEPCNLCEVCVSITNGSHIDVIEIDAASNRGIDEMRDLREKVKYAPATLKKKIYIIDEVHMLTNEAFNALLKTLEEPPEHVIFILATTEMGKLPQTILSRTFYVPFEKPTKKEIERSILRIIEGEKLEVEEGVMGKLFELSDGAFRDATKILEEVALQSQNKKITVQLFEDLYKLISIEGESKKLLNALYENDVKKALLIIESLSNSGCDFKQVIEKIVGELRMTLLELSGIVNFSEKMKKDEIKTNVSIHNIEIMLTNFNEAYKQLRYSVIPQLPLELVVIKWCLTYLNNESEIRNPENVTAVKYKKEDNAHAEERKGGQEEAKPVLKSMQTSVSIGKSKFQEAKEKFKSSESAYKFHEEEKTKKPVVKVLDFSPEKDFLSKLIQEVQHDNTTLAGILRSCRLGEVTEELIEIIAPYKFHTDKLNESKSLKIIVQRSSEILRRSVLIKITLVLVK